jgi:arabinan endo-1,5-alpha-L-arabinosidase
MLTNHHEVLIQKNASFVGTGHNSEIVSDKAGNDWVFYHGVDVNNPHGRVLLLDQVQWKDGWPLIKTSSPSTGSDKPVFK